MFRPQPFFTNIPCPAGARCSLVYCLFSHDAPAAQQHQVASQQQQLPQQRRGAGDNDREMDIDTDKDSISSGSAGGVGLDMEIELSSSSSSSSASSSPSASTSSSEGEAGGVGVDGGVRVKRRKVEIKPPRKLQEKGVQAGVGRGNVKVPVVLQKQQQQVREQQHRMASVAGARAPIKVPPPVTTTATKSVSTSTSSTSTPLPTPRPSLSTTVPPALTYAKALSKDTVITTSTPIINTTPIKMKPPALLVPASVSRCPAKWGTRVQLLTLLHAEYTRLYQATPQDPLVIALSVEDEAEIARSKGMLYPNVMKNRITALKKASPKSAEWAEKRLELQSKRKVELRKGLEELAGASEGVKKEELGGRNKPAGSVFTSTIANTRSATATPIQSTSSTPVPPPQSDIITDPALYKSISTGLSPAEELSQLSPLLHPPATLIQYGHILTPPSSEDIARAHDGVEASGGWEICERCDTRFQIFPGRREMDGALSSGGKCVYHYGRAMLPPRSMTFGLGSAVEKTYTCCKSTVGTTAGCVVGDNHVFKISDVKRLAGQWQWVPTYPSYSIGGQAEGRVKPQVKVARAYALDCEMCYTTLGMEMVRITMVEFPRGDRVAIDALVRPKGEILDLNTRFSGVSAKEYISAKPFSRSADAGARGGMIFPSPEAAREEVLRLLRYGGGVEEEDYEGVDMDIERDGVSVLLGHALENDLHVLRICHPFVVDTCILFPHSRGFPVRNKLAWVAEKYLRWRIQATAEPEKGEQEKEKDGGGGGGVGHDSAIDARCAGELVRWKIREGGNGGGGGGGGGGGNGARSWGGGGGGGFGSGRVKGKGPGASNRYEGVAGYVAREKLREGELVGLRGGMEVGGGGGGGGGGELRETGVGTGGVGMEKRKRGLFTESDGEV